MANTGKSYKCSICDSPDHTARNHAKLTGMVQMAPRMAQVESKGRACSYCHGSGHYAATCSAKAADMLDFHARMDRQIEAEKLARRQAASAILGFSEYHPAHRFVSVHIAP